MISFQPGEEDTHKKCHHTIPVLKMWLQSRWRLTRRHIKRRTEEVSSWFKTEKFQSENNRSLKQLSQGCGRVFITESFQVVTGQCARKSHPDSLFQEKLNQVLFQSPLQLVVFYDSTSCSHNFLLSLLLWSCVNNLVLSVTSQIDAFLDPFNKPVSSVSFFRSINTHLHL